LANPQLENGHLKIANEVWEHLIVSGMSAAEIYLVMAVIRQTWGWNRKRSEISLLDFQKITRQPERTIAYCLRLLIAKKILQKEVGGGRGISSKWSFNKNWEQWETLQPTTEIKVVKKNSAMENSVTHCSQTVQPIAEISATHCRVSPCNLLPGMEQLAPKATFKAIKDNIASKEAPSADERLKDLKKFISEEFYRIRGFKLFTDSSDWTKLSCLLKSTKNEQAFCLEKLQSAWTNFLESGDDFHQKQGHPLRYWASNINAFIGGLHHKQGRETNMQKLAREKREKLDAKQKNA